jgi:hypothetical protein
MAPSIDRVVRRLREAEVDLAREAHEQQKRWHYRIHRGRVWCDAGIRRAQRRFRQSIPSFLWESTVASYLTAPLLYSLLLPFLLLDLWVTVAQLVCFPIYGIARVRRRPYFAMDRGKLAYLNGIEKLHCAYCSYANGLLGYIREVAARTEQYWCPIKHARPIPEPHTRYHVFFDYGDAAGYRRGLAVVRRELGRTKGGVARIDRPAAGRSRRAS